MTDGQSQASPIRPERPPEVLVARLVGLFDLEQIEINLYRGPRTHEKWTRIFGGQVIGQALMAACRTVDGRQPHSLHAYFIRPGDPSIPVLYQVGCDRDGRSFTSRRVVAIPNNKPILNLAASFHKEEEGMSHQFGMPNVPGPEGLENDQTIAMRHLDEILPERRSIVFNGRPLEFRPIDSEGRMGSHLPKTEQAYWFRVVAPLPDDRTLHRVVLAYASDMLLLATAMLPHGINWLKHHVQEASLDHALWFHSDLHLDDWHLYCQDSPWSGDARGLARGLIYSRDGRLVASVVQEGLIRIPKRPEASAS
jgi:acyl-CoA thioesterase-2